jgi:hypothetical protein
MWPAGKGELRKKMTKRCNHFWVLELANGPESSAKCKHCGVTNSFHNSGDLAIYRPGSNSDNSATAGGYKDFRPHDRVLADEV